MTKFNIKFLFFINIFLVLLSLCFKSYAEVEAKKNLTVLGKNDAPIKIKIFSSLTCPHCANFHINVVPKIKKDYILTGKVQLIFMDFPLDQAAFNAAKLLNCLDHEKKISFLDAIYENQNQWTSGANLEDINNNLKKMVKSLGLNLKKFDKCLNDENVSDKILNARIEGQQKYSIDSTPTIIINEKKLEGNVDYKNIKKRIDKLI